MPGAGGPTSRSATSEPYTDLPDVIAIERRAFPAPWSLAMFVLELSKPASICIGAFRTASSRGYLICSRYHTVWHLMNVAVDLGPPALGDRVPADRVPVRVAGEHERYTLEVRVSNTEAIQDVRVLRLPQRRGPPPLLPRQQRRRPDHVAYGRPRHGVTFALRTALLWVVIYVVLGLFGGFDGAAVAQSLVLALAITGGIALAERRRGTPP